MKKLLYTAIIAGGSLILALNSQACHLDEALYLNKNINRREQSSLSFLEGKVPNKPYKLDIKPEQCGDYKSMTISLWDKNPETGTDRVFAQKVYYFINNVGHPFYLQLPEITLKGVITSHTFDIEEMRKSLNFELNFYPLSERKPTSKYI